MIARQDSGLRHVYGQAIAVLFILSISCSSDVETSQSTPTQLTPVQGIDPPTAEGSAKSADQPDPDLTVEVESVIENLKPTDPVGICTYYNFSVARDLEYGRAALPTEAAILAGDAETMLAEWRNDSAQLAAMGTSALIMASSIGCTELMNLLIQDHAPVNEQFPIETPLIAAVVSSNAAAVRLLLDHGADPDLEAPYEGNTPLHAAANFNNTEVLQVLLDAGADPDKADSFGGSLLTSAAYGNSAAVASMLFRLGLALQPVDVEAAISLESVDFVRAASEAGAIAKLDIDDRRRLAAAARDKGWIVDESAVSDIVRLLEEGT